MALYCCECFDSHPYLERSWEFFSRVTVWNWNKGCLETCRALTGWWMPSVGLLKCMWSTGSKGADTSLCRWDGMGEHRGNKPALHLAWPCELRLLWSATRAGSQCHAASQFLYLGKGGMASGEMQGELDCRWPGYMQECISAYGEARWPLAKGSGSTSPSSQHEHTYTHMHAYMQSGVVNSDRIKRLAWPQWPWNGIATLLANMGSSSAFLYCVCS